MHFFFLFFSFGIVKVHLQSLLAMPGLITLRILLNSIECEWSSSQRPFWHADLPVPHAMLLYNPEPQTGPGDTHLLGHLACGLLPGCA